MAAGTQFRRLLRGWVAAFRHWLVAGDLRPLRVNNLRGFCNNASGGCRRTRLSRSASAPADCGCQRRTRIMCVCNAVL